MSKVPRTFEEIPFSRHRSVSVRERRRGQQSPQLLRRSASTYNNNGCSEATPAVEVGSKGSIFSLVGRDTSKRAGADNASAAADEEAAAGVLYSGSSWSHNLHVWHNRLWLVLPIASKKLNYAANHKQPSSKSGNLAAETLVESKCENRSVQPKWKRLLQKLKGYSNTANSKRKEKVETREESTLVKCLSIHMSKAVSKEDFAHSTPHMPLQTELSPTSLIWERRNFLQINPLDLSHLHTSRLKKAHTRPLG